MGKDKPKNEQKKGQPPRQPRRRPSVRARRQSTSIYFLLWTIFTLLSMLIVLGVSLMQQILVVQSFKDEASREISEKGESIKEMVLAGPPEAFGDNNYHGYIHFLSTTYDVNIYILDGNGNLIHPKDPNLDPESPEYEEHYLRKEEAEELLNRLDGKTSVVYEGDGEYIYGAEIVLYGDTPMYLHVGKSMHLMATAVARIRGRTILLSLFVFVVAFAISSAVAGWLVNPLTEMTKKAHKLAEGDFDVDFYGDFYGRELVELAESLNFARDELSKTDRMQKELIANVSHDFKTPLTMIKGYASMIMEISGDIPEKRNKHAQIIVDEADRLASLVNDVLDLSKIQAGITQLEKKTVDMSSYLYEVLDRFAYVKDTQGYSFVVDIDEGLLASVDEVRIGQALYNLISNAVNYTGEDKTVYVSLKKEGEACFRFTVRDTGSGIKQEELADIWDRYYRTTSSHKRPVQGTGLGLSIVKTILSRHGFIFGVDSEVGKGSTFYVLFPMANGEINERKTVDKR